MQPVNTLIKNAETFPDLPIYAVLPSLQQALQNAPQVILQAEPGAGKSTLVPLFLLQSPSLQSQKILMLEPRRLAAKRLAEFLAQQLGESLGETVGYSVRNESRVSSRTRLQIITEGVLTRLLQKDPELPGVGLVIFDEFHERSLQADLGLTLLLEVQQNLRDDLRCLIMSATLDEREIERFLPDSQRIFCPGRTFPVTLSYHPAPPQTPLGQLPQLPKVLHQALQQSDGDILLFFAGQAEILRALSLCRTICTQADALALPLYGNLNVQQQEAVFRKSVQRKVIFSTNIAETSITLQGVSAVIDTGLHKQLNYDPNVGMSRLQLQRISQASATQRMGRAGRVRAGYCYRLWSATQQQALPEHDMAEICRADLTNLRMELAQWGASADELSWLSEPPSAHLAAAQTLLVQLGFLSVQGRLSLDGEQAIVLHPEPRLAKLLQLGEAYQVPELACDLVALLQEGEVLQADHAHGCDITLRLHWLWQALRDSQAVTPLQRTRWLNFKQSRQKLYQRFCLDQSRNGERDLSQLGLLLARSFPDRIGKRRDSNGSYKLSNGRGAQLAAGDCFQGEWLVALAVDGQSRSHQQNARIFLAAQLDWQSVADQLPLRSQENVYFDACKQRVVGERELWLDRLRIAVQPLKHLPVDLVQPCLLAAVAQDFSRLPWSPSAESFLKRLEWLAQFEGFEGFVVFNQQQLKQQLDWLEPYSLNMRSIAELQKLNLLQILQSMLDYSDLQRLQQEAPAFYVAPTGREFAIEYSGQQAKVSLPLQQIFGELVSPQLAGGQVSLTFELLSPAQRPIQTTADLANFWQTSYFEVAKEMRGRYPKHRWPEQPLMEKPGTSIQRKEHRKDKH